MKSMAVEVPSRLAHDSTTIVRMAEEWPRLLSTSRGTGDRETNRESQCHTWPYQLQHITGNSTSSCVAAMHVLVTARHRPAQHNSSPSSVPYGGGVVGQEVARRTSRPANKESHSPNVACKATLPEYRRGRLCAPLRFMWTFRWRGIKHLLRRILG